jgi:hypothetical protein
MGDLGTPAARGEGGRAGGGGLGGVKSALPVSVTGQWRESIYRQ